MATVHVHINGRTIKAQAGSTVLQAARKAGIALESPCNAAGTCGKCKIRVSREGTQNLIQRDWCGLTAEERREGWVLSCQAELAGDVVVEEIRGNDNGSLKILSYGRGFDVQLSPRIQKKYAAAADETLVSAGSRIIAREPGNTARLHYGLVVDIGTTTLVASLVEVATGQELAAASALNPQAVHAQDVLSRIQFASEEEGLRMMSGVLIDEVNRLIGELTEEAGVCAAHIYEAIFSGNTCMLHLAAGVNPRSLGQYPYQPAITGGSYINAGERQLRIAPDGEIYFPPLISAYVGADITSGLLAAQLHDKAGTTLLVDIGTNGEMVIGMDGKLSAASTAAGPAFEGMNIACGMRAGKGAVELFQVEEDGGIFLRTIGGCEPTGICGSGLLDLVGELVACGVIRSNGKLAGPADEGIPPALRSRLEKREGKTVFKVTDNVFLSQKDIRQVQLAKAAVRAGIEFLLDSKGVKAAEVDAVLIAGSFGYHLRVRSLIHIGLLPPEFAGKVEFIGNSSKSGGHAFLLNEAYRSTMKELAGKVEVVELATRSDFEKVFVKCLSF